MFETCLIDRVLIVQLLSVFWLPLVNSNTISSKDFLGVDLNKSSISVICNTTTIVTVSDQLLHGCPWDRALRIVAWIRGAVLNDVASHVICERVFTDLIVRIVESV